MWKDTFLLILLRYKLSKLKLTGIFKEKYLSCFVYELKYSQTDISSICLVYGFVPQSIFNFVLENVMLENSKLSRHWTLLESQSPTWVLENWLYELQFPFLRHSFQFRTSVNCLKGVSDCSGSVQTSYSADLSLGFISFGDSLLFGKQSFQYYLTWGQRKSHVSYKILNFRFGWSYVCFEISHDLMLYFEIVSHFTNVFFLTSA